MPVKGTKRHTRFTPSLKKTFVGTHEGFDVYTVDAFAIRNYAQPDEEFTNFATPEEFPDLIPEGEIWISHKLLESEGVFFIANALTRLQELQRGISEERADEAGLKAERLLREQQLGVRFRDGRPHPRVPPEIYAEKYITLPDPVSPVEVWLIEGKLARAWYKTDYTEGGHGYVYPWVPRRQIWIEKALHRSEIPFILCHEYIEMRLMRDEGLDYDRAHEICSKMEFSIRKGKGAKSLLAPGRRKLVKRDLPHLTKNNVFYYVLKTYVKK